MEPASASTSTFTVRARHPTTQQIHTLSLDRNVTSKEAIFKLLLALELRQFSEDDLTLVVGASPTFEGALFPPNTKLDGCSHLFKPDRDILELHMRPLHARIIHVVDGAAVETKKVMVDYTSRLCDVLELFKYCLPKMNMNEDYAVQFNTKEGSPFLNTNQSLQMLGFDAVKDVISLVSVKSIAKTHWQRFGAIIKRGWIYIGHGKDVDAAEKGQRRYAILVEHFLVIFKKEGEVASQAIALDVHTLKRRKDEKGQMFLSLTRLHPKKEERDRLQSTAASMSSPSATGTSGGSKVKNTVLGVVSNMQQRVNDMRLNSKNVWVISGDDNGTSESLDLWFKELSAKCANTGVRRLFGIPLEETLSLKNKRMNHVPPIVSKIISHLDHKLETEGLFRLQGSHAAVDIYRDKFELGVDFDLTECLDPHVPATIMKQFFRELPEPLLQFANYDVLIELGNRKIPIEQKKDLIFARLKETLPPLNMGVLLYLLGFLNRVNRMSDINKMGLSNIATVFGPNLLRPEEDNPLLLLKDTQPLNEVIQILVQYEHDLATMMAGFNPLQGLNHPWSGSNLSQPSQLSASSPSISATSANSGHSLSQSGGFISRARGPTTVAAAIAHNHPSSNGNSFGSSEGSSGSTTDSIGEITLQSSASNPTLASSSTPPLPSAAPAKRIRPKGGHYTSIAPMPAFGFDSDSIALLALDTTSSQSTGDIQVPHTTNSGQGLNMKRTSTMVEPLRHTNQNSGIPRGGVGVLPRGQQLGGIIHSATTQGLHRATGGSGGASSQPPSSPSSPPTSTSHSGSGGAATAPSPAFSVNTTNLPRDQGPLSPISPRAAPPPPLGVKTGPASFSPVASRDAYTKSLEDQIQGQKTQITNLESEVQRLQALLKSHGVTY